MKKSLLLGVCLSVFAGCATTNITPSYVSPTKYQSLSCNQLVAEYNRVQEHINTGPTASKRVGSGVGIGLSGGYGRGGSWGIVPSISINMGQASNSKRTAMANLLGEQDAIAQAAKFKNCPAHLTTQHEKRKKS